MERESCYRTWTDRDLDIVESLAVRVSLLSLEQIAAGWWPSDKRSAASAGRRLASLVKAGLLVRYTLPAHPLLDLGEPVSQWAPGQPPPTPEAVAWQLQRRWTEPSQPTPTFAASKLAANLYGSFAGKRPNPPHATHDLHLGQVFLWYRRTQPDLALIWLGESVFPKAGFRIKDPDAFLVGSDRQVLRVVEFGGRYDAERVADFHEHCSDRSLPYELW